MHQNRAQIFAYEKILVGEKSAQKPGPFSNVLPNLCSGPKLAPHMEPLSWVIVCYTIRFLLTAGSLHVVNIYLRILIVQINPISLQTKQQSLNLCSNQQIIRYMYWMTHVSGVWTHWEHSIFGKSCLSTLQHLQFYMGVLYFIYFIFTHAMYNIKSIT